MNLKIDHPGFSLIELMVAVTIIGIFGMAVIVSLNPAQRFTLAKTNTAIKDGKTAADAIERCITVFLSSNPSSSETAAVAYCSVPTQLGITVGANQVLNANAGNTSLCFSELTGAAGVYVKYVHTNGSAGTYTTNAPTACIAGL